MIDFVTIEPFVYGVVTFVGIYFLAYLWLGRTPTRQTIYGLPDPLRTVGPEARKNLRVVR